MSSILVEPDKFSNALDSIVSDVGGRVEDKLPGAIQKGLYRGANEWRKRARDLFNGGNKKAGRLLEREAHTYFKSGRMHTAGAYSRSIRSHMLRKDGPRPTGEIGSAKLPGLPHLLELGHAKVGGGRVQGFEHIAPSAQIAFDTTYRLVEEVVDNAVKP